MEVNILTQDFYSDKAAQGLVEYLRKNEQRLEIVDAVLYYKFPLFKNVDENVYSPSIMLVDAIHGILLFRCDSRSVRELEANGLSNSLQKIDAALSEVYNFVLSKLIKNRNLRKSRDELVIKIFAALYIPFLGSENKDSIPSDKFENELLISEFNVSKFVLESKLANTPALETLRELTAVLEGAKGIIKPKERNTSELDSKGAILAYLEKEIATLDKHQKHAALTQLKGPQRIRGLAGSGKTIVLSMKAALIHQRNPEARILYTFYTKSLYDYMKRLITRFYRDNEDTDPDWNKICIRHAWGGASLPGVYYETCKENGIQPLNLKEAQVRSQKDLFDYVCSDLLRRKEGQLKPIYDYVLIDEAQDFRPSFYQLCRQIVREDCIVWGYDELQNILNVKVQSTVETFRNPEYGYLPINLEQLRQNHPDIDNDVVLPKCYRSPRNILVLAHAIGFGIYNKPNIVQMLENKGHWEDLGYEVLKGDCKEGDNMIISRPEENSPLGVNIQDKLNDLINYYVADDFTSEVNWIANAISKNIQEENLKPEDVLVICIDDRYARRYFSKIAAELIQKGILSVNVLENTYSTDFFVEGNVTLSTVYRAKGNEAAMVYVIGTDTFYLEKDSRTARNKLFTAFTRSKAWLTVTGAGEKTNVLIKEIRIALDKMPNLEFIYPNVEEMDVLQRDLADDIQKRKIYREKFQKLKMEIEKDGISYDEISGDGKAGLDRQG